MIDQAQSDLGIYTQADGLVGPYGELDEDRLRTPLVPVRAQRSQTERQIDTNRALVAGSTTLSGVASPLEVANARAACRCRSTGIQF